ncbi:M1 family metallopeptidase [Draconibacterium sp.]|nr:M1 family metallopeptidase [Draconibacterium sp.]
MNIKYILIIVLHFLFCASLYAQNHYTRFESIDIQHYSFEIHLNDTNNRIEGKTTVKVKFLRPSENIVFDLIGTGAENKGMSVTSVLSNNKVLKFSHIHNQLDINLRKMAKSGDILEFIIEYSGVPADGLVISENRYGDRTFFGDNWPDRAKHWLPTVDHPSDKATLEFLVYAPEHYEVISNGYLFEKKQLANHVEFSHWKEDVPLSTKLMVIGVADFAVGNKKAYRHIPVSSWVFPQNREKGFENYKYGTEALKYFSELIGPYSYEKLAHVQSKTRYGGMENAGCIFYSEGTGYLNRNFEGLFAHETAHQWFGNSVTEQNWHHIWLSEGFATYLTHVYQQTFHGEQSFREGLKKDRQRVIRYAKQKMIPIIDTTITDYTRLLNANSYQKASWFLHMLHADLGDDLFFKGLRKYYADFQDSTALTKDFQNEMELVTGKELDLFFSQWLWQPGHPVLDLQWKQKSKKKITIKVNQMQSDYLFVFPLDIEIHYKNGTYEVLSIQVDQRKTNISIPVENKIEQIEPDPEVKLLFERVKSQGI